MSIVRKTDAKKSLNINHTHIKSLLHIIQLQSQHLTLLIRFSKIDITLRLHYNRYHFFLLQIPQVNLKQKKSSHKILQHKKNKNTWSYILAQIISQRAFHGPLTLGVAKASFGSPATHHSMPGADQKKGKNGSSASIAHHGAFCSLLPGADFVSNPVIFFLFSFVFC